MSLLGGIGQGLAAGASQYREGQQQEIARKEREKQLQLQGLNMLLGQNDLPMDQYVDTIGAIGQLTGHKPTQQAADLLRQHIQQAPIGPPQETPESVARRAGETASHVLGAGIGATSPIATAPSVVDASQMPRNVYNEQMMMPTRIAERAASMKPISMIDPNTKETVLINPINGMEMGRTKGQIASVYNKAAGIKAAQDNIDTRFENQLQLIGERGKVKAHADIDKLVAGGMSPEDASAYVIGKAQQDKNIREARIGLMAAQKNAIPERVAQGWANVEANQLRTDITADLAKKNIDTAAFDRQTKFDFDDLNHINSEIDALQKRPDLLNGADKSWNQQLLNLTDQRNTILNDIYTKKGQFVPAEQATPRTRGGGRQSPSTNKGPNTYNVPLSKYGLTP